MYSSLEYRVKCDVSRRLPQKRRGLSNLLITLQLLKALFYLLASIIVALLSPLPELKLTVELLSKEQPLIEPCEVAGGPFLFYCSHKETGDVSINSEGPADGALTGRLGVLWTDQSDRRPF